MARNRNFSFVDLSFVLVALVLLGGVARSAPELPLPPARGPLEFTPGETEISLYDLVVQLARLTGQELAMAQPTDQALRQGKEQLERTEPVPPNEVYSFVEGLLARQGVVIAPLTGGTRPILGVYMPSTRDMPFEPMLVPSGALNELALHPALHVRFLVTMKYIDTRQMQTQLRQLTIDNTGVTQMVPVGERAMLLQGRASDMAALAKLMLEADEAAGARPPAPAAKPEGEAK